MELMITVGVIGILAGVALPAYDDYVTRTRLIPLALRIDNLADLLKIYKMEHGDYPPDSNKVRPPGLTTPDIWGKETELGGVLNWDGGPSSIYNYAGISIDGAGHSAETIHDAELFDRMIGDGDLTTGNFRYDISNFGRYTYVIEWN